MSDYPPTPLLARVRAWLYAIICGVTYGLVLLALIFGIAAVAG